METSILMHKVVLEYWKYRLRFGMHFVQFLSLCSKLHVTLGLGLSDGYNRLRIDLFIYRFSFVHVNNDRQTTKEGRHFL